MPFLPQDGCDCWQCESVRRLRGNRPANRRAEKLLEGFLLPEQLEDWRANNGFNVRGSDGFLYRVNLYDDMPEHQAVVRQDGWGTSVWITGVDGIRADNALGLLLNLQTRAPVVLNSGCHGRALSRGPLAHPFQGDYGGAL